MCFECFMPSRLRWRRIVALKEADYEIYGQKLHIASSNRREDGVGIHVFLPNGTAQKDVWRWDEADDIIHTDNPRIEEIAFEALRKQDKKVDVYMTITRPLFRIFGGVAGGMQRAGNAGAFMSLFIRNPVGIVISLILAV